ncbi:hypothetical protein RFI_08837, partial [Reticulomyxa filosa]
IAFRCSIFEPQLELLHILENTANRSDVANDNVLEDAISTVDSGVEESGGDEERPQSHSFGNLSNAGKTTTLRLRSLPAQGSSSIYSMPHMVDPFVAQKSLPSQARSRSEDHYGPPNVVRAVSGEDSLCVNENPDKSHANEHAFHATHHNDLKRTHSLLGMRLRARTLVFETNFYKLSHLMSIVESFTSFFFLIHNQPDKWILKKKLLSLKYPRMELIVAPHANAIPKTNGNATFAFHFHAVQSQTCDYSKSPFRKGNCYDSFEQIGFAKADFLSFSDMGYKCVCVCVCIFLLLLLFAYFSLHCVYIEEGRKKNNTKKKREAYNGPTAAFPPPTPRGLSRPNIYSQPSVTEQSTRDLLSRSEQTAANEKAKSSQIVTDPNTPKNTLDYDIVEKMGTGIDPTLAAFDMTPKEMDTPMYYAYISHFLYMYIYIYIYVYTHINSYSLHYMLFFFLMLLNDNRFYRSNSTELFLRQNLKKSSEVVIDRCDSILQTSNDCKDDERTEDERTKSLLSPPIPTTNSTPSLDENQQTPQKDDGLLKTKSSMKLSLKYLQHAQSASMQSSETSSPNKLAPADITQEIPGFRNVTPKHVEETNPLEEISVSSQHYDTWVIDDLRLLWTEPIREAILDWWPLLFGQSSAESTAAATSDDKKAKHSNSNDEEKSKPSIQSFDLLLFVCVCILGSQLVYMYVTTFVKIATNNKKSTNGKAKTKASSDNGDAGSNVHILSRYVSRESVITEPMHNLLKKEAEEDSPTYVSKTYSSLGPLNKATSIALDASQPIVLEEFKRRLWLVNCERPQ